jgi:hypothetical protein
MGHSGCTHDRKVHDVGTSEPGQGQPGRRLCTAASSTCTQKRQQLTESISNGLCSGANRESPASSLGVGAVDHAHLGNAKNPSNGDGGWRHER